MNNLDQTSRRHHFVPEFLLRPWTVEGTLHGYWWNHHKKKIDCKRKGPRAFCNEIDLLTLQVCSKGHDAIEKRFFGHIDTKGAESAQKMAQLGIDSLSDEERSDFGRLLLSLELRRPSFVHRLKAEGGREIRASIDGDDEILAEMAKLGLAGSPLKCLEQLLGTPEDIALTFIQDFVDNPKIGSALINSHWHIFELEGARSIDFVTSDRPFVRVRGYGHPGHVSMLPLSPSKVFVATNHLSNLDLIRTMCPRQFTKKMNVCIANQTQRFIFSVSRRHSALLNKYLIPK